MVMTISTKIQVREITGRECELSKGMNEETEGQECEPNQKKGRQYHWRGRAEEIIYSTYLIKLVGRRQ